MADRRVLASDKINLEKLYLLLVDDNPQCLEILAQVVSGFGARHVIKCSSAAQARETLLNSSIDLVLTDVHMPGEDGYQLIEWIRREAGEPNRYVPIILISSHSMKSRIARARDCGASFFISKPITPQIVVERIFWAVRDDRGFIECEAYAGPDRRFKRQGTPPGTEGRRSTDVKGEIGEATGPNLSQDLIDNMLTPQKASL